MSQLPLPVLKARLRVRRAVGTALAGLRTTSYIRRWLILGVIIGIVAGTGAIVFFEALDAATRFILGTVGGYHPAGTAGEGGIHAASGFARPWAVPLVVGTGGLVAGILVFGLAPEAEGHGTDAAIDAVHHNPRGMRGRVAAVKIVASAITIGSGGSGGREGPTAQISASFGSILARSLNLTPADARIAVSAGIASGIGAIFRAPLGGAVLGAELLYRDDVEFEALIPSVIASIVAFAMYGSVEGFGPIFGYHTAYRFEHVSYLAYFALLGLIAGGMGRLYAVAFYRAVDFFRGLTAPRWLLPGLAGVAVGLIGLAVPGALGTGYGAIQQEMSSDRLGQMSIVAILALPLAKIVATSLSIGSGGSGGIFGPGMVIGGATGAALWRLLTPAAGLPHSPGPFVIVGMIACFGAVAHAPLAVMLMVAEMTGNLALLAPAMVAVALAVLVVGDTTIYRSQLRTRADSPAHRFQFGLPLATSVPIGDVMAAPRLVLRAGLPAAEALERLLDARLPGAPVVDSAGVFVGSIQKSALAVRVVDDPTTPVGRLADGQAMTVPADAALDAAIEALATSRGAWVPVLDSRMHVLGIIGTGDLVRGYRMALRLSVRRLGRAAKGTSLVELHVRDGSAVAGQRIGDLALPRSTVVVTVLRGNQLVFAEGETVLQPDDVISVLTRPDEEPALQDLIGPELDSSRAPEPGLV